MARDDHSDDKLSWSEIDKLKDRSKHVERGKPRASKKPSVQEEWAKKQYLKEIDKLFSGKQEETEDQKRARVKISQSYGTSKFNSVVEQYIRKYGFPEDWGTLMVMLDHKNPKIVLDTLKVLMESMHEKNTSEQQGFLSKVRILAMTADDDDLRESAEEIVEKLE